MEAQKITYDDVVQAARRIGSRVREAAAAHADGPLWFALEFLQHTGTFKARGALNLLLAHREAGTLPEAGVAIASGGNAGMACAWAAGLFGVPATVFVPETAPKVKVERLRGYGADVRQVGAEYAEALGACREFTASSGALASHAYDDPLIAAGAGTLVDEIRARVPDLATIVVSAGGGGLFTGVATAADHHGLRTVVVEPEDCRALNAALEAGRPVDVPVDSVAADALGARRASRLALDTARTTRSDSVLVTDLEIIDARRRLWERYRLAVEHSAATAYAGLSRFESGPGTTAVVLCGANTDPSDLA
ncbi:threonine/serine dehydratase [Actinocorallia libanotica]|uniref:Threonine/serine dehydratase n=1 Tax=Actinocorallia libanotica TaxID=46162 RepID=A0ABN1Q837_9ACTN